MSENKEKAPKQVNIVFVVLATALFASLVTLVITTVVINDDPVVAELDEQLDEQEEAQRQLEETTLLLANPIEDQISKAEADVSAASTPQEKSNAYLQLGSVYLNQQDLDQAQTNFDLAFSEDPQNQAVVNALYALATQKEDVPGQIKYINLIIEQLDTEDPQYNAIKSDLEAELERLENES